MLYGRLTPLPPESRNASRVLLVQRPANQPAPNLRGPPSDLEELGVSQEPPGGVVVDVPVPAEDLDRVQANPGAPLADEENDGRAVIFKRDDPSITSAHFSGFCTPPSPLSTIGAYLQY